MNEPKRRGRPPKTSPMIDAPEMVNLAVVSVEKWAESLPGTVPVINGHGAIDSFATMHDNITDPAQLERLGHAQAYANRVWCGQSITAERAWRVARVMEALEGQGLPTEGVILP